MSGTHIAYPGPVLRACYAMSGTDYACAGPTRCPLLRCCMLFLRDVWYWPRVWRMAELPPRILCIVRY
eukprot:3940725-Rhodomonas_salina.2